MPIDPNDPNAQFIADFIRSHPIQTTAADAGTDQATAAGPGPTLAPGIGSDVSHLMGGASSPQVGEDVSHLMGDQPPAPTAQPPDGVLASIEGAIGDVAKGALKGAGQTATNLGALVHKIPGVDAAVDALYGKSGLSRAAFAAANADLAPTDTAQFNQGHDRVPPLAKKSA